MPSNTLISLDVQLKSFQEFFQLDTPSELGNVKVLFKVFRENFPITDTRNIFRFGVFGLLRRPSTIYHCKNVLTAD